MFDLMQMGLDAQQAIVDANRIAKVYEIKFVELKPQLMSVMQSEAHHLGLILQVNPKTMQTIMCEKVLQGFQPVRTGYKNDPEDFTPEAA